MQQSSLDHETAENVLLKSTFKQLCFQFFIFELDRLLHLSSITYEFAKYITSELFKMVSQNYISWLCVRRYSKKITFNNVTR